MEILEWNMLSGEQRRQILVRPSQEKEQNVSDIVANILKQVKDRGDQSLKALTAEFDGVEIKEFRVTKEEVQEAYSEMGEEQILAMKRSYSNICEFHQRQVGPCYEYQSADGALLGMKSLPIETVGLYIPGGTAPLPSTVLMLGVPAQLAGCKNIILCTPPQRDGKIHPAILVAADMCGLSAKIFKVGGAQAIGAMAYGTESIERVNKIFGPGNTFVTMAKQMVAQDCRAGVSIDMPAGPSEVLVLADRTANASYLAADLLSQAEHGRDSQVILLSNDKKKLLETIEKVKLQLAGHKRMDFILETLEKSRFIWCESLQQAVEISNLYAPEHLIIQAEESEKLFSLVLNAGSVFLGHLTPESAGDYSSGTNHVLPTGGMAKSIGGVNTLSFQKTISYQKFDEAALSSVGPTIEIMATIEGLTAHKDAVSIRLADIRSSK